MRVNAPARTTFATIPSCVVVMKRSGGGSYFTTEGPAFLDHLLDPTGEVVGVDVEDESHVLDGGGGGGGGVNTGAATGGGV